MEKHFSIKDSLEEALLVGVRILVVDDDEDSRYMLEVALAGEGAEVVGVSSVREALTTIALQPPSILVSDIKMPQEDGYDLIRRVKTSSQGGKIQAIAVTAFARDEDRRAALAAGFQQHFAKPVDLDALTNEIARLSGRL